jgi:hypothetical protein
MRASAVFLALFAVAGATCEMADSTLCNPWCWLHVCSSLCRAAGRKGQGSMLHSPKPVLLLKLFSHASPSVWSIIAAHYFSLDCCNSPAWWTKWLIHIENWHCLSSECSPATNRFQHTLSSSSRPQVYPWTKFSTSFPVVDISCWTR